MKGGAPTRPMIHPYDIFIVLVLGGITAAFAGLSIAFIYSRVQGHIPPVHLPVLFYFNTLLLLGSSFWIQKAKKAYKNDKISRYLKALNWTLILSIVFLFMQILAWWQLFDDNVSIQHSTTASYLYVISGLHFLHVIAGIPFLAYFLYHTRKQIKEPVRELIYLADPDKKRQLTILAVYWHFLDALWIYLVLFFALNYLIA